MLGLGRLGDPTHTPEPSPQNPDPLDHAPRSSSVVSRRSLTLAPQPPGRAPFRSQRVAKGLEHTTCAPPAASVPTPGANSTTDKPWTNGGRTDLTNAIPLCHQHHQWIHDTGFNHQSMPDGSVRFSRRT